MAAAMVYDDRRIAYSTVRTGGLKTEEQTSVLYLLHCVRTTFDEACDGKGSCEYSSMF